MNITANKDLDTANPVGLVWSAVTTANTGYIGHVLRLQQASGFTFPSRAILIRRDSGQWSVDIRSGDEQKWAIQETTYDDLETAKAVAVALVAMESK